MTKVLGVDAPTDGLDPMHAVLAEIGYAASACAWLRAGIAELDPIEAAWGTTSETTKPDGVETRREAKPHVLVVMLGEWSDRLVSHCRAAGALGIDQSLISVVEAHGIRAAVALEQLLSAEPGLPDGTRVRMLEALPGVLRAGEGR